MAYNMYASFVSNMAKTPKDNIITDNQAFIDRQFQVASTFETVQEQNSIGSKEYTDLECRLTSVIDPKTGNNFGDQYRKIIFQQFDYEKWLGRYYQFDDKYWLTTNTSTKINASAHVILRQCNNYLKWIDANGELQSWECVFDRSIVSTNMNTNIASGINQVNGIITIYVQRNEYTDQIKENDRFVFDGYAFQVQQINNHVSDTLLELYMFQTQVGGSDDVDNNVANGENHYNPTTNEIIITPYKELILVGENQTYEVYQYQDGVKTDDEFTFNIGDTIVPATSYTLTPVSSNSFILNNISQNNNPLPVECTNNTSGEVSIIFITLGGSW